MTKYRVPSTEYRVPSTEYRVPSTEYRVPSTEYRVPSTEYRVPSTEYRVPSTFPHPRLQGSKRSGEPIATSSSAPSNKCTRSRIHRREAEGGMADLSDAELLRRFRAGDAAALDALCDRHETPLYCF